MSLDHFLDKPILFPKTNAQQLYSWLGCKTLSHVYTLLINELSSSATTELLLLWCEQSFLDSVITNVSTEHQKHCLCGISPPEFYLSFNWIWAFTKTLMSLFLRKCFRNFFAEFLNIRVCQPCTQYQSLTHSLSLSLSYTHTHTHTHSFFLSAYEIQTPAPLHTEVSKFSMHV